MLLKITGMDGMDISALMAIYAEGNEENAAYFFPDLPEPERIRKAKAEFARFLKDEFFPKPENVQYVLEEGGEWVAALRLTKLADCWWLEALETKPGERRKGHALALLRAVQAELGPGEVIRDCVSKRNEPSLRTHFAAGFEIENDPAVDYLLGEIEERCFGMRFVHNIK